MPFALARPGGNVVPFPPRGPAGVRLGARDRAEAQAWEAATRARGPVQLTVAEASPDGPHKAEIVVVHWRGRLWIVRRIARPGRWFGLWRRKPDAEGEFPTSRGALDAICAAVAPGRPAP